jgi:deoxycytidylate deaminase
MTPPVEPQPEAHIIDLAVEVSGWSPCRSKRGVAIFRGENVVTHGYNYKPRGFDCDGTEACKATCRNEAIHAEQQALLSAGRKADGADMLHVKTVNGQLVASGGPSCVQCSKLALACGIAGVWLYHAEGWRRYDMQTFHRLSLDASPAGHPPTEAQQGRYVRLEPTWNTDPDDATLED